MKHIPTFSEFLTESANQQVLLTGEEMNQVIDLLVAEEPTAVFSVPADIHGHASTYKADAEKAKKNIEHYATFWHGKSDPAGFYVWHVYGSDKAKKLLVDRSFAQIKDAIKEHPEAFQAKGIQYNISIQNKGVDSFKRMMSGDHSLD